MLSCHLMNNFVISGPILVFQLIYFSLALCYDVLILLPSTQKQQAIIVKWKGYLYSSIIFPAGLFVSLMFWGLYNIDTNYVLPRSCFKFFPKWLNHSLHTVTSLIVILEFFIIDHPQQNPLSAIKGYTTIFLIYHTTYVVSRFVLGFWLYPIFNLMTAIEVALFITFYYSWNIGLVVLGIEMEKIKLKQKSLTNKKSKLS